MNLSPVVKTVKSGAMEIGIRKYADGRFGFDFHPAKGEREKIRLLSLDDAVARAKVCFAMGHVGKLNLLSIDPAEWAEFERWKATRRKERHTHDIVADFIASKKALAEAGEITPQTSEDLERILDDFVKHFTAPLDVITRTEMETWLNDQKVGPKRWNAMRAAVVGVIRQARIDKWIGPDITPIEQIQKRAHHTEIGTFTPAEMVKILKVVEKEWLASVVLGGFAGVRPEEICPPADNPKPCLRWENVLWAKATLDVPKLVSKTGRRRFVPLCEAALAFLSDFKGQTGPMVPRKALANQIRRWAKKSGVVWKNDALRHSYASYRLAITKDIQALSLEMGNSAKIIHDHYLELKHEDEAVEWFAIRP